MRLYEFTRLQLINRTKSKGFNRYHRRLTINPDEINIDYVVIGKLKSTAPHLDIYFKVRSYVSSVRILNFVDKLKKLMRSKYRNDLRKIVEIAFNYSMTKHHLQVNCTCPDFYYRFSYTATIKGYGFNTNQLIPASIRNPKNRGSMCKHLTRIINAPSLWKRKVISSVVNAIRSDPSILGEDTK